jgi:hypothetical protein
MSDANANANASAKRHVERFPTRRNPDIDVSQSHR